jgi:hypothetical protein
MNINRWTLARLGTAKASQVAKTRTGWNRIALLALWIGLTAIFSAFGAALGAVIVLGVLLNQTGSQIIQLRQRKVRRFLQERHHTQQLNLDRMQRLERENQHLRRELERKPGDRPDA